MGPVKGIASRMTMTNLPTTHTTPTSRSASPADLRRWRQYLADERAEAGVYRDLAGRRSGEEREILLALAEAETRHEQHWLDLLGDKVGKARRGSLRTRFVGFLARHFGSVFVLALAQPRLAWLQWWQCTSAWLQ